MSILFGIQNTHIREASVFLIIIKSKTDDKLIRNLHAHVIRGEINFAARWFVEHSTGFHAVCISVFQQLRETVECPSRIYDIFDDDIQIIFTKSLSNMVL